VAGLEFISHRQAVVNEANTPTFEVGERLYVNADRSKIVSETSPEAAYLLAPGPGHRIPMAEAVRLGLAQEKKSLDKPEDKALDKPADKAVRKHEDKGRK